VLRDSKRDEPDETHDDTNIRWWRY
jgi:hypothetical protein